MFKNIKEDKFHSETKFWGIRKCSFEGPDQEIVAHR